MPERRQHLHSRPAVRWVTAVLTVWCLGCSAFDPLLCALFGTARNTAASCATDERASASSATGIADVDVATPSRALDSVSALAAGAPDGCGCGCLSCNAPAPAVAVKSPAAPLPSIAILADEIAPSSLAHEPLVPPPQGKLAA